jgi:hypothetical protein
MQALQSGKISGKWNEFTMVDTGKDNGHPHCGSSCRIPHMRGYRSFGYKFHLKSNFPSLLLIVEELPKFCSVSYGD